MAVVVILFVVINVASIKHMPPISSAQAVATHKNIQEVEVTAVSWSYDISNQEYEVGRPVRFSAKSADTMHSFAVYHPDGRMLFTMMLMPGLATPTSIVHTFTEPGTYKVRCLEYCGAAHHEMQDELIVKQRSQ
jgi:cytochrome c oxidase subunit 2